MSSFTQGLAFGRSIYNDTEAARLRAAEEARQQEEFDWRREEMTRQRGIRADDEYTARRGVTGITPNMTVAPGGMGPVADPADLDWQYNERNPNRAGVATTAPVLPRPAAPDGGLPASIAARDTAPVAGVAAASPGVSLPSAGMSEAEQTKRIGASQLRNKDYQGFYGSQDRAQAQAFNEKHTAYMKSLIEMPPDQFSKLIKETVTDNPKLPTKIKYDPKTERLSLTDDDGTKHEMTRVQAITYLSAAYEMGNGKVEKGLEKMMALGKERRQEGREDVKDANLTTTQIAKQNLDVKDAELRAKTEARKAAAAEKVAAHATKDEWKIDPRITDKDGNVLQVNQRTGESKPMLGVKPVTVGDRATHKDIADTTKQILETGGVDPNTGKKWTVEGAREAALVMHGVKGTNEDDPNEIERMRNRLKDRAAANASRGNGGKTGGVALGGPSVQEQIEAARAPINQGVVTPEIAAQRRAALAQERAGAEARTGETDPVIQSLEYQRKQAIRANKGALVNELTAKIAEARRAYGQ